MRKGDKEKWSQSGKKVAASSARNSGGRVTRENSGVERRRSKKTVVRVNDSFYEDKRPQAINAEEWTDGERPRSGWQVDGKGGWSVNNDLPGRGLSSRVPFQDIFNSCQRFLRSCVFTACLGVYAPTNVRFANYRFVLADLSKQTHRFSSLPLYFPLRPRVGMSEYTLMRYFAIRAT